MKITKRQLAKIIKEEYDAVVGEADEGGEGIHDIFNLPPSKPVEPSGNPKEDALRQIVADNQAAVIKGPQEPPKGTSVDLTTANAIVQYLDNHPEEREEYLKKDIRAMAKQAWGR